MCQLSCWLICFSAAFVVMNVHKRHVLSFVIAMSMQELKDRAAYYSRLSLFVNADTFDCARLSCGGVIEMCRAVVDGRIRNGFAVVRPPGHHSEPEDPSGFCVFNNAAVTAKWLRTIYPDKIRRVLLIDWWVMIYQDHLPIWICSLIWNLISSFKGMFIMVGSIMVLKSFFLSIGCLLVHWLNLIIKRLVAHFLQETEPRDHFIMIPASCIFQYIDS